MTEYESRDEMPPLERAAHLLRETQTLWNGEDESELHRELALDNLDAAIDDIQQFVDEEIKTRLDEELEE